MIEKIHQKGGYSLQRIKDFQEKLSTSEELKKQKELCIYTTGSYGRLEASEYSDIDLFFLHDKPSAFPKLNKTLIDAHIIVASREMNFPEFSGDGEYLEIHSVQEIYRELGSRKDDYHNFFTARMLLLLESKPIYNEELHSHFIDSTIDKYYKDFHEHEKNFQPVFIVNDVIRFWRTICLNYEHNRNRKFEHPDKHTLEQINRKKSETHVKNIKLKFSRKLTCFSFLLSVLYRNEIVTQEDIKGIISQTPLVRLANLIEYGANQEDVNLLVDLYFWFLETTQKEKQELVEWIGIQENRDLAFSKSREFAKLIFKMMMETKNKENLSYFLI